MEKEIKEYTLTVDNKEYYIYEVREENVTEIFLYDKNQDNKLGSLTTTYNSVDSFIDYELEQFKKETLNEESIKYLDNLIQSVEDKENIIYINDLEVKEGQRGNGIGAILLDIFGELLKKDIKLGFNDSIYLNSCPTDAFTADSLPLDILTKFYSKRGFKSFFNQGVNDNMLMYDTRTFIQSNKIDLKEVITETQKEESINKIINPKI